MRLVLGAQSKHMTDIPWAWRTSACFHCEPDRLYMWISLLLEQTATSINRKQNEWAIVLFERVTIVKENKCVERTSPVLVPRVTGDGVETKRVRFRHFDRFFVCTFFCFEIGIKKQNKKCKTRVNHREEVQLGAANKVHEIKINIKATSSPLLITINRGKFVDYSKSTRISVWAILPIFSFLR